MSAPAGRRKKRLRVMVDETSAMGADTTHDISSSLTALLADFFAIYVKTEYCHWHLPALCFRNYHTLLDAQADQIFATLKTIAERTRNIIGITLRSTGQASQLRRLADNNADFVIPSHTLAELQKDNTHMASFMREIHRLCDEHGDVATASFLGSWIDEAEQRAWFLFESCRIR